MGNPMGDEVENPPCAGMLSFSRASGQTTLFGTPFVHQGFIRMVLRKCVTHRSLSNTWHMGGKEYVEVWLSYSQFAEAITGDGVPCTVKRLMGERFDPPKLDNARIQFDKELDQATRECVELIAELVAAIQEEKMSKRSADRLIGLAHGAIGRLSDSAPFIAKQYAEYLSKVEQQAKTEIAAYADMTVHQTGLSALAGEFVNQTRLMPGEDRR